MMLFDARRCCSTRCALPRPISEQPRRPRQEIRRPPRREAADRNAENARQQHRVGEERQEQTCEGNQRMQVSSRKSVSRLIRNKSSFILRSGLDTLYDEFNAAHAAADPVWFAHRFSAGADREVVAFIAAALAFGRVQSVLNSIEGMLGGDGPLAGGVRARIRPLARPQALRSPRASLDQRPGLRGPGVDPSSDDRAERLHRRISSPKACLKTRLISRPACSRSRPAPSRWT